MSHRRNRDDELAAAEQAAQESRRRADRDAAEAVQVSAKAQGLTERLQALNASNGFAELLFDAVIRGAQ